MCGQYHSHCVYRSLDSTNTALEIINLGMLYNIKQL